MRVPAARSECCVEVITVPARRKPTLIAVTVSVVVVTEPVKPDSAKVPPWHSLTPPSM
jgi:hypothetical protein